MASFRHACIFIDGENLRHSLCELFAGSFNPADYLPKQAEWGQFFNHLVAESNAAMRFRTYWYVVDEIDFWPYDTRRLLNRREFGALESIVRRHKPHASTLDALQTQAARKSKVEEIAGSIIKAESFFKGRFDDWRQLQNGIASRFDSVEFRRAGSIRMNLFTKEFGQEKGVDVKLATDLLKLNDIFDVGIIVSGDGDYVPAVEVVKDQGKHIINVSFLKKNGDVLPGGARRLNRATDRAVEVAYQDIERFMKVAKPTAGTASAASAVPSSASAT